MCPRGMFVSMDRSCCTQDPCGEGSGRRCSRRKEPYYTKSELFLKVTISLGSPIVIPTLPVKQNFLEKMKRVCPLTLCVVAGEAPIPTAKHEGGRLILLCSSTDLMCSQSLTGQNWFIWLLKTPPSLTDHELLEDQD